LTTAAGRLLFGADVLADFPGAFFAVFGFAADVFAAWAAALVILVVTVFVLLAAAGFLAAAAVLDFSAALGLLPAAADARLRDVVFAMADPPLQTPVSCPIRPQHGRAESGSVYPDSGLPTMKVR
jgi:lysylphosphatidylglycerol synthetase-like protein (DUF2156 family)